MHFGSFRALSILSVTGPMMKILTGAFGLDDGQEDGHRVSSELCVYLETPRSTHVLS